MKSEHLKNKGFLSILILSLLFIAGCKKDFFEKKLYGILDQFATIKDEASALALVNGCYAMVDGTDWWSGRFQRMMLECSSDNGWGGNDYQDRPTEMGIMAFTNALSPDEGNYIKNFFDILYLYLLRIADVKCNKIAEQISIQPVALHSKINIAGQFNKAEILWLRWITVVDHMNALINFIQKNSCSEKCDLTGINDCSCRVTFYRSVNFLLGFINRAKECICLCAFVFQATAEEY